MHWLDGRVVKFTVRDPAPGADALDVSGFEHGFMPHAIAVLKRAAQDVGDDLHVAVRVRAEAAATGDRVVVDNAQRAEAHPTRLVIVRERKCVVGVQPTVVGVASFVGSSNCQHSYHSYTLAVCQLLRTKRGRAESFGLTRVCSRLG